MEHAKGDDLLSKLSQSLKLVAPIKATPSKSGQRSEIDFGAMTKAEAKLPPAGRKAIEKTKAKVKGKKTRLKLPRNIVRDIKEAYPTDMELPKPDAQPMYDYGKAAFERVARLRPGLASLVADHRAPASVSGDTTALVARRIEVGARNLATMIDPDVDGYIGYDFGTSSTKTVVRWPLRPRSAGWAISVPTDWRSGGQPHLWPSVVFFDPAVQTFSLLPASGLVRLDGFKASLVSGEANRIVPGTCLTMEEVSVAFLALHIAYVLGEITEMRDGKVSALNVAIPVASLLDAGAAVMSRYERVVHAALRLVQQAESLSLDRVRAGLSSNITPLLEPVLHPELSGIISGYSKGPRHHIGSHMIIDCGSATLDMATFNLDNSDRPLTIYASSVELLGADASKVYCKAGATIDDCRGAASWQDHEICRRSLAAHQSGFVQDSERKYGYQVILAGGGIDEPWIAEMLGKWQGGFDRRFIRPSLDPGLKCQGGSQASRLIIADGLAWDPIDLKKIVLPISPANTSLDPNYHDWTSN